MSGRLTRNGCPQITANLLQYGFLDFSPLTDPALRQVDLAVPSTLTLFREPPPPVSEPPPFTSVQQLCREHTSSRHEERPTRNHSPL